MTYTDEQLKRALAKMLPEKCQWWADAWRELRLLRSTGQYCGVLDTELLHLCWLVEEDFSNLEIDNYWNCLGSIWEATHATWQQRTIALARVKGVEIV